MTRTFLVTLDIDPGDDPVEIASMLAEDLPEFEYAVISVKPWAQPNTQVSTLL